MQGKMVLGTAACSSQASVGLGREMLCTTRACLRGRGRQMEEGKGPPQPQSPRSAQPQSIPEPATFGSAFGNEGRCREQSSAGEGEREKLAD